VSEELTPSSASDRGLHLEALHAGWVTPLSVVSAAIGDVANAPVLDIRRIVAGGNARMVWPHLGHKSQSVLAPPA